MASLFRVALVATYSGAEALSLLRCVEVADATSRSFRVVTLPVVAIATNISSLSLFRISLL